MVLGASDAMKRELEIHRRESLYKSTRQALIMTGLTEFMVDLIETSAPWQAPDSREIDYIIQGFSDHDKSMGCIKTLYDKNYICYNYDAGGWQLKVHAEEIREQLIRTNPKKNKDVAAASVPAVIAKDSSINNSGLFGGIANMWYNFVNREEILRDAQKAQLEKIVNGHEDIEGSITNILEVDLKTFDAPTLETKTFWSEAMQRRTNDLYWMSGGDAFWLNPNGMKTGNYATAPALPAPDWWSIPDIYKPRERLVTECDVLDASLLPPPDLKKEEEEELDVNTLVELRMPGQKYFHGKVQNGYQSNSIQEPTLTEFEKSEYYYEEDYRDWMDRVLEEEEDELDVFNTSFESIMEELDNIVERNRKEREKFEENKKKTSKNWDKNLHNKELAIKALNEKRRQENNRRTHFQIDDDIDLDMMEDIEVRYKKVKLYGSDNANEFRGKRMNNPVNTVKRVSAPDGFVMIIFDGEVRGFRDQYEADEFLYNLGAASAITKR